MAKQIEDLEAGEIPTEKEAEKVRGLIEALGGVPGTEHLQYHQPEHHEPEHHAGENAAPEGEHHDANGEHVNGWEESFIGGN